MATKTMTELEEKKRKLEAELDQLQDDLDNSVDNVKNEIVSKTNPVYWIREYPLESVAFSAAVGFLVSFRGGSARKSYSSNQSTSTSSDSKGLGIKEAILKEVKKKAMKIAIDKITELLDEQLKKRVG